MKAIKEKGGLITHYEFVDGGIEERLSSIHGDKFREYRKKWHYCNDNFIVAEKPLYIVLETNTYCNLKCKMCEKNFYTRNKKNIEDEVINKIVNEVKQMEVPSILVGAAAESLINPHIKEILLKIKETGAMDKFVITNGTKLTTEMSEFLINNQFERLYVSIDAATAETYSMIRGTNLSIVENNVYNFLKIRDEFGAKLPLIRVSFCLQDSNRHEVDAFINKWKEKVDIIDIQKEIDFSNLDDLKEFSNVEYKCAAPFTTLSLDCEGNIYPCCTFYRKYHCLGNIKDISLMEAWNCEKINILRKQMIEGKLCKACKNCSVNVCRKN